MPYSGLKLTPYIIKSLAKSYFTLHKNLPKHQTKFLEKWITKCSNTAFGKYYNFSSFSSIKDFQKKVPFFQYDDMWTWIERALRGERNVFSPGKVEWFATSSGTTGASKYIPVTKRSLKANHFKAGTTGMMLYALANPKTSIFIGQNLVIGGSFGINPYTNKKNIGFISAILQKNSPIRAKIMKQPKTKVSYLLDREKKVEKIISSSVKKNITSLSGQPSRCSEFLAKVLKKTGKKNILEVRPHFQLLMWGGMGIDLYKETFASLLPSDSMQYYQIYNASEGFFAMQHENSREDMLLFLNHGVFYEFIPVKEYRGGDYSTVYTIDDVKVDEEYVIVVTTNAGLRRYILGDTIIFTGLGPHTIRITGRTKYYIDVVGECTPLKPIEEALHETAKSYNAVLQSYTVGPSDIQQDSQKRGYELVIERKQEPICSSSEFAQVFDKLLCEKRAYYRDERYDTDMLQEPIVHFVPVDSFYNRLQSKGKLGGQHKVPKLSNSREIVSQILGE